MPLACTLCLWHALGDDIRRVLTAGRGPTHVGRPAACRMCSPHIRPRAALHHSRRSKGAGAASRLGQGCAQVPLLRGPASSPSDVDQLEAGLLRLGLPDSRVGNSVDWRGLLCARVGESVD